MNTTDLKQKLATTADKAKETASAAMEVATEAGRTVASGVKAHAADTLNTVRDAAAERGDAARDTLVTAGERLHQATLDTRRRPALSEPVLRRTLLALCMMAAAH